MPSPALSVRPIPTIGRPPLSFSGPLTTTVGTRLGSVLLTTQRPSLAARRYSGSAPAQPLTPSRAGDRDSRVPGLDRELGAVRLGHPEDLAGGAARVLDREPTPRLLAALAEAPVDDRLILRVVDLCRPFETPRALLRGPLVSSGGGIRTRDLRVMRSPEAVRWAYPER